MKNKKIKKIILILISIFILRSETAVSLYQEAESLFKAGNYTDAIYYYKKSLEKNRYFSKSLYKLAVINFKINNLNETEKYLKRLLKVAPDNIKGLLLLADVKLKKNKTKDAAQIYKRILKKSPLNYDAFVGLGNTYILKGYFSYAEKQIKKAIKIDSERPDAYISMAKLYIKKRKLNKASEYLNKARYLDSKNPDIYFFQGLIEEERNNLKKAAELFTESYDLNPNNYSAVLNLLDIYFKLKKWDKAKEFLNKAISNFSDVYLLYYNRALANIFTGNYKESFKDFKKSLSYNSNDDLIKFIYETMLINFASYYDEERKIMSQEHFRIGAKYESRNLLRDALYEYKRGLRLFSEKWDDRYRLAKLYKKMGFLDLYLKELKIAYSLNRTKSELKYKYDIASGFKKERLSYKLNIDQYDINKDKTKLLVLNFKPMKNNFIHNYAGKIIADSISYYFRDVNKFKNYKLNTPKYYFIRDRNEIAKIARENGFNYYTYGFYKETPDTLYLEFDVYSVKRDESIKKIRVVGSGRNKLYKLTKNTVKQLTELFPTTGRILKIKDDFIVINLGFADGIKKRDKIEIYDYGNLTKDFIYSEFTKTKPKKKATATIYKIDEQIALAKLDKKSYILNVSINDKIKLIRKRKK